jgi:amylosucrase
MSFGGIPLIYYGDEIGALNDVSYLEDMSKANDSRWIHRPRIDWQIARLRHQAGSVQQRLFDGLQNMIAVRKATRAFADFNNRALLNISNTHVFVFLRALADKSHHSVLVIANFSDEPQRLDLAELQTPESIDLDSLEDLLSGGSPERSDNELVLAPRQFLWLGC